MRFCLNLTFSRHVPGGRNTYVPGFGGHHPFRGHDRRLRSGHVGVALPTQPVLLASSFPVFRIMCTARESLSAGVLR